MLRKIVRLTIKTINVASYKISKIFPSLPLNLFKILMLNNCNLKLRLNKCIII